MLLLVALAQLGEQAVGGAAELFGRFLGILHGGIVAVGTFGTLAPEELLVDGDGGDGTERESGNKAAGLHRKTPWFNLLM